MRPCANGNVLGFQFTPLREGRHKAFVDKFKPKLFQFTPLREGRPTASDSSSAGIPFQFTPLREGRRTPQVGQGDSVPFQFTPLREGRRDTKKNTEKPKNFNSRPSARGDARWLYTQPSFSRHFNSRPSARGDSRGLLALMCSIFQFTPLREGRPRKTSKHRKNNLFQFTPLREGRRLLLQPL